MTTVALLGTGTMGLGMGRSMLREGLTVRAWNRTPERAEPLAADGAILVPSAVEAVAGADVVLSILYDAASVLTVVGGAAGSFEPDAVWLQASTIGIDGTAQAQRLAGDRGLRLVDAPVLGTKGPAENGSLLVIASGPEQLRQPLAPVFDAIGSRTMWISDRVGDATALKLACNAWVASLVVGVGQSLGLAAGLGLDPQLFLDAIAGGATDSPYAQLKGRMVLADDFTPSFELDAMIKDLDLIRAAARSAGVATDVLTAMQETASRASAAGHGGEDMAAVATVFRSNG